MASDALGAAQVCAVAKASPATPLFIDEDSEDDDGADCDLLPVGLHVRDDESDQQDRDDDATDDRPADGTSSARQAGATDDCCRDRVQQQVTGVRFSRFSLVSAAECHDGIYNKDHSRYLPYGHGARRGTSSL